MKNFLFKLWVLLCLATLASCEEAFQKEGSIIINISTTKASEELPDIEDFILDVTDSKGKSYYNGSYASSPEKLSVPSGSYTVSAVSLDFEEPAFDCPQFGDTQVVTVSADETVRVLLNCTQINSGIKIRIDQSFMDTFPDSQLLLKGNGGELYYGYNEKRTAFFKPGKLTVELSDPYDGRTSLFVRQLAAQEILNIKLSSSISETSGGISIQLDTSRTYHKEEFVYGSDNAGNKDGALDITTAKENIGRKEIWVWGYIVGCANGSSSYQFAEPFEKNTNIIIGIRTNSRNKDYLMSVELKSGDIREELNLQYNSNLLGKKIYLCGDIVSAYFGLVGLKNLKEYQF